MNAMTLTARLLGDPTPDRMVRAEERRRRLIDARPVRPPYVAPKVVAVIRALADGPLNHDALSEAMGVRRSSTCDRVLAARGAGLIKRENQTGQPARYGLTELGRRTLAELDQ